MRTRRAQLIERRSCVAGIIVLASAAGCAVKKSEPTVTPESAVEVVTRLYEAVAGAPIEIMQARPISVFYKITFRVRGGGEAYQDVYVTKDGRLFAEKVLDVAVETQKALGDKRVVDCILGQGVSILIMDGERESEEQRRLLGPYAGRLLVHCNIEPRNCERLGAKSYPSILQKGAVTPGAKPRAWLETLTGCK